MIVVAKTGFSRFANPIPGNLTRFKALIKSTMSGNKSDKESLLVKLPCSWNGLEMGCLESSVQRLRPPQEVPSVAKKEDEKLSDKEEMLIRKANNAAMPA